MKPTIANAVWNLVPDAQFVAVDGVVTEWHVPSEAPVTQEQIDAELARLLAEWNPAAEEARTQRNALLMQSDWTQLPDAPVDAAAWATYRQALRDISAQEGFPDNIQWPVQP